MFARTCLIFSAVFAAGCADYAPERDGKVPGDLLGTYEVKAALADDQCGADLLSAQDPWHFQVKLSRFARDLYWLNGREAIVGEIDADDRSFHFSTRVDVPVSPTLRGKPGCVVERYDVADGTLAAEGNVVAGFVALLSFAYRPKSDSECIEIIGVPGGFSELPCRLSYELEGVRLPEK